MVPKSNHNQLPIVILSGFDYCVQIVHTWREPGRHFGVQSNLDPGLDLVLTLDEQIQQLLSVDHGLTEVGHQTNQGRVPFVHNLVEKCQYKTFYHTYFYPIYSQAKGIFQLI